MRAQETLERAEEFKVTIGALLNYRNMVSQCRPVDQVQGRPCLHYMTREPLKDRIEQATYRMRGATGEYLGESLRMLMENDILLRDVHLLNIGWRVHETIDEHWAPDCIVIYDPGHTPTPHRPRIEQRMIENASWPG
jgi:hypothetical protein